MEEKIRNFKKMLIEIINKQIEKNNCIDIFQVTGVNLENQTCNIKRLNLSENYNDVGLISIGLGNGKGVIKIPAVNDLVLVTFITGSKTPFIIGNLYDNYSIEKDAKIQLKENEYYVSAQTNGAFMFFKENNEIILRTPNGAKIKLKDNGEFKIFDANDYGLVSDGNGNISIYGDVTFYGSVSDLKGYSSTTVVSQNSKTQGNW